MVLNVRFIVVSRLHCACIPLQYVHALDMQMQATMSFLGSIRGSFPMVAVHEGSMQVRGLSGGGCAQMQCVASTQMHGWWGHAAA